MTNLERRLVTALLKHIVVELQGVKYELGRLDEPFLTETVGASLRLCRIFHEQFHNTSDILERQEFQDDSETAGKGEGAKAAIEKATAVKERTAPIRIPFPANGGDMFFENNEEQKSWLLVFAESLAASGIDPEQQEYILPDGRSVEMVKAGNGYNLRLI